MKLGVSTYSLVQAMKKREMDVGSVIDWIADQGGEHVEIVPIGFEVTDEIVKVIRDKSQARGLAISNYAIGANFLQDSQDAVEREIERVCREVDRAAQLGVRLMRHDVASGGDTSIGRFNRCLAALADACRRVADYAAQYRIVTSVENHGFFIQASDRVQTLLQAVDRPNFRTTLDVGNFLAVDEDPVAAVRKNLPYASMVHIKDFHYRRNGWNPGEGWFATANGHYLRGAIAGHGNLDLRSILSLIKHSGYDGYISLEFEGMEDCRAGTRIGLANVRRIWDEA